LEVAEFGVDDLVEEGVDRGEEVFFFEGGPFGRVFLAEAAEVVVLEEVELFELDHDVAFGEFEGELRAWVRDGWGWLVSGRGLTLSIISCMERRSLFRLGSRLQPRRTEKLRRAAGRILRSLYQVMSTPGWRLLSFWRFSSTRRPTWANWGDSQPKALYSSTCLGVEMSHSCDVDQCLYVLCQGRESTHGSSDDMGDLHVLVVDDVGKVIGGEAVGLDNNVIIFRYGLLEGVVDQVLDLGWRLRAAEAHNKGLPFAGAVFRLVRRDTATCAWVVGGLALFMAQLALVGQILLRAEASVRLALINQFLGMFVVETQSLRLRHGCQHRVNQNTQQADWGLSHAILPAYKARTVPEHRAPHPMRGQPI
jgi:hypothetical protein